MMAAKMLCMREPYRAVWSILIVVHKNVVRT